MTNKKTEAVALFFGVVTGVIAGSVGVPTAMAFAVTVLLLAIQSDNNE